MNFVASPVMLAKCFCQSKELSVKYAGRRLQDTQPYLLKASSCDLATTSCGRGRGGLQMFCAKRMTTLHEQLSKEAHTEKGAFWTGSASQVNEALKRTLP